MKSLKFITVLIIFSFIDIKAMGHLLRIRDLRKTRENRLANNVTSQPAEGSASRFNYEDFVLIDEYPSNLKPGFISVGQESRMKDLVVNEKTASIPHDNKIKQIYINLHQDRAFLISSDGSSYLYDINEQTILGKYEGQAIFSNTNQLFATVHSNLLTIFNHASKLQIRQLDFSTSPKPCILKNIAFNHNDAFVAVNLSYSLLIYNTRTRKLHKTIHGIQQEQVSIERNLYPPINKLVLDMPKEEIPVEKYLYAPISKIVFAKNYLIVAYQDQTLKAFHINKDKVYTLFGGSQCSSHVPICPVEALVVSPDNRYLIFKFKNCFAKLFDLETKKYIKSLYTNFAYKGNLGFTQDSKHVIMTSFGKLHKYDINTDKTTKLDFTPEANSIALINDQVFIGCYKNRLYRSNLENLGFFSTDIAPEYL